MSECIASSSRKGPRRRREVRPREPAGQTSLQTAAVTLGNLTLTAFNTEMGNRPFRDKRDAEKGYRDSPLRLNADLRQTERWDGDAIRARGARLADDAVGIWKRPVLPDRVLEPYRTTRAGAGRYTIEHHPHLRPGAPMHDLFEAVRQEILGLAPEVREEFTRHYVAYKTQTNFTDVVPQKRRLLLTLNMRFDDISDPRGLAADITNLGLWGNGDVQLEVDTLSSRPRSDCLSSSIRGRVTRARYATSNVAFQLDVGALEGSKAQFPARRSTWGTPILTAVSFEGATVFLLHCRAPATRTQSRRTRPWPANRHRPG